MSEQAWGSATSEPPAKKKSVPTWLWVLGSGCLVLIICGMVAAFLGWRALKRYTDPERQWPEIARVLPIDPPYPEMKIIKMPMGWVPGIEGMWTFIDPSGRTSATLMHFSGEQAKETRSQMFDTTKEVSVKWLGGVGRHEVEKGTIDVQGRTIECLRYQALPKEDAPAPGAGAGEEEEEHKGVMSEIKRGVRSATIQLDLTAAGSSDFVVLQLQKNGTLERFSDEEVRKFLEPFHVGPNR